MATKTFELTGPKAVVAAVLVVAFGLFRLATARQALGEDARDVLALEVQSEYARGYLQGLTADNTTPAMVDSLLATSHVTFPSLSARGPLDNTVVRAEVLLDGKPPPDGRSVRYFRMEYGSLVGWRLKRGVEPGPVSYYLAIF